MLNRVYEGPWRIELVTPAPVGGAAPHTAEVVFLSFNSRSKCALPVALLPPLLLTLPTIIMIVMPTMATTTTTITTTTTTCR